jgi:cell division septation protein DedD
MLRIIAFIILSLSITGSLFCQEEISSTNPTLLTVTSSNKITALKRPVIKKQKPKLPKKHKDYKTYRNKPVKKLTVKLIKQMTYKGPKIKELEAKEENLFRVVVGFFDKEAEAQKYCNKIKKYSNNAFVWKRKSGEHYFYTVQMGFFKDRKLAMKYTDQLNMRDIHAYYIDPYFYDYEIIQ